MKVSYSHTFAVLFSLLMALAGTVAAQNTIVTYQGRLLDGSTPFNGTGQFQFALVTSTNLNRQATATANRTGSFVTSYNLISGGNGYVTPPTVHITGGGGSGATATATINGGAVTAINPGNAGGGYTNTPTVTIDPPPANILYTTFWSNDGTSVGGSEPSGVVSVPVNNGLFTVALGDVLQPNMIAIDASVFDQPNLQLRIWFNDGTHGFVAMDPPQNLTAAPYAATAARIQGALTIQQNTNGAPNMIGGSPVNFVAPNVFGATIAGGGVVHDYENGGDASSNRVMSSYGTVGGGAGNTVSDRGATVGGGKDNIASGYMAVVSGGIVNTASGDYSTVGGGGGNFASGSHATVGGGVVNTNTGDNSTIPGGSQNLVSGKVSFAAGGKAIAAHNNSFVWSDGVAFSSTAANQFAVRAAGGIVLAGDVQIAGGAGTYHNLSMNGGNSFGYLYGAFTPFGDGIHLGYNAYVDNGPTLRVRNSGGATSRITAGYGYVGVYIGSVNGSPVIERLYADSAGVRVDGTFNNNSDRNVKQDFAPVSPAQILEKIGQLPVSEWSYKDDPKTRHIGPMAQDFHAAFNIGTDEKHIAPIDEGGIAFAAIKGLNEKVEESKSQIAELKVQNEELKRQLTELKAMLNRAGR